jgi:hypothetical protein
VSGITRALGQLANERGKRNELRMLAACLSEPRPKWLRDARLATREEDARGIDIVVTTDVGDVYLQVKSSRIAAEIFQRRPMRAHAEVVVSNDKVTHERLIARAHGAVSRLRAAILQSRKR